MVSACRRGRKETEAESRRLPPANRRQYLRHIIDDIHLTQSENDITLLYLLLFYISPG
jgi:hypothetical protein